MQISDIKTNHIIPFEIEDIKLAKRLLYGVSFIIWALGVLIIALFFS